MSQEKKVAAKQKISQMEAELEVASKEMKAAKEEEDAQRLKSIRWAFIPVHVHVAMCILVCTHTDYGTHIRCNECQVILRQ